MSIILFIVGILAGGGAVLVYSKYLSESTLKDADQKAKKILAEATLSAENVTKTAEIKAKDEMLKLRNELENENKRKEMN